MIVVRAHFSDKITDYVNQLRFEELIGSGDIGVQFIDVANCFPRHDPTYSSKIIIMTWLMTFSNFMPATQQ